MKKCIRLTGLIILLLSCFGLAFVYPLFSTDNLLSATAMVLGSLGCLFSFVVIVLIIAFDFDKRIEKNEKEYNS